MLTNTPGVWVLTIVEVAVGWALAANGYPFAGGLVIGLAVGAHVSRAANSFLLKRVLAEGFPQESSSKNEAR